jgi:hypothetical protein
VPKPDRVEGERTRLEHSLNRHVAQIEAIRIALRLPGPIGAEMAQAIVQGSLEIAMQIARHDAFDLVDQDS